jgi:hypothetical protein
VSIFRYKSLLFPTLIAACFANERNRSILQQELDTEMLCLYIQEEMENSTLNSNASPAPLVPPRFQFSNRFPTVLWKRAVEFFSTNSIGASKK